jgi:hypothetical protein
MSGTLDLTARINHPPLRHPPNDLFEFGTDNPACEHKWLNRVAGCRRTVGTKHERAFNNVIDPMARIRETIHRI